MCLAKCSPRASDRSDRYLGSDGVARYILHTANLWIFWVLSGHVQVNMTIKHDYHKVNIKRRKKKSSCSFFSHKNVKKFKICVICANRKSAKMMSDKKSAVSLLENARQRRVTPVWCLRCLVSTCHHPSRGGGEIVMSRKIFAECFTKSS